MLIDKNSTVLFQGDSITDAGRSRSDLSNLGTGYAMMAASLFSATHPEMKVTFLNRGVSGNRAKSLEERWLQDCLDLKPNVVSIMIGINDTWRRFDSNDPTSTEDYERACRNILRSTLDRLKAKLILIEPFLLPVPPDRKNWRIDLDPKLDIVRRLAKEFKATLVPMDSIFAEAARKRDAAYWAPDGVHPTLPGHALIAMSWLKAVGAL